MTRPVNKHCRQTAATIAIGTLAVILVSCGRQPSSPPPESPSPPAAVVPASPAHAEAPRTTLPQQPAAPARPEPVAASFPAAGRVAELLVEAGTEVEAGQLLARLDSVKLEQAIATRQADLVAAEDVLLAARTNYLAQRQHAELGRPDETAISNAYLRFAAAAADRDRVVRDLELAHAKNQVSALWSPAGGTVRSVLIATGETVKAGQPLILIEPR